MARGRPNRILTDSTLVCAALVDFQAELWSASRKTWQNTKRKCNQSWSN